MPQTALTLMQNPGPERWHPDPEFLFQRGAGPVFDVGPYYLSGWPRSSARPSRSRPRATAAATPGSSPAGRGPDRCSPSRFPPTSPL